MAKIKTYVLTLSKVFPSTHKRKGEETYFHAKFNAGQKNLKYGKIHTIRANYPLWNKRMSEILAGRAVLSIRQWTGKPYRSKQVEIALLTKENGIGIQRMTVAGNSTIHPIFIDGHSVSSEILANNDGLSRADWGNWFSGYDLTEPLAVIQFTKFRY